MSEKNRILVAAFENLMPECITQETKRTEQSAGEVTPCCKFDTSVIADAGMHTHEGREMVWQRIFCQEEETGK